MYVIVPIHSAVLEGVAACAEVLAAADSLLSQSLQLNLCILVLVYKQVYTCIWFAALVAGAASNCALLCTSQSELIAANCTCCSSSLKQSALLHSTDPYCTCANDVARITEQLQAIRCTLQCCRECQPAREVAAVSAADSAQRTAHVEQAARLTLALLR
jgi:hypothetical protein